MQGLMEEIIIDSHLQCCNVKKIIYRILVAGAVCSGVGHDTQSQLAEEVGSG